MSDVSLSHDRLLGMMSNSSNVSTNVQSNHSGKSLGSVSLSFVGRKEIRAEPVLEKGKESPVFSSKNSCVSSEVSSSSVSSSVSKVSISSRRNEIMQRHTSKEEDRKVILKRKTKDEKCSVRNSQCDDDETQTPLRTTKVEEGYEDDDETMKERKGEEKEEEKEVGHGEEDEDLPSDSVLITNPTTPEKEKHSIQVKSLESIDVMRKQCPIVMYLECPTDQRELLSRWNDMANKNKEVPYLHRFVKEKEDTVIIYEWNKRTPQVTFLDNLDH